MQKSIRTASLFILAALFVAAAPAADVDGILVDKMCSADVIKKGQKAAAAHTKDCALMDGCQSSGFGVYTADGNYLTFDDAGNQKAIAALKGAKKEDNLRVRVSGTVAGDSIRVASLKLL